jgi:predicted nicotinamide N-methyase
MNLSEQSMDTSASCSESNSCSSSGAGAGNDDDIETTTSLIDPVVLIAIVELEELFDATTIGGCDTTNSNNNNVFITKIRIHRSEVTEDTTSTSVVSLPEPQPIPSNTTRFHTYIYTVQDLRNKIYSHFAGRTIRLDDTTTTTTTTTTSIHELYHISMYDSIKNEYKSIPEDDTCNVISLFGTRWRIRVVATKNMISSSSSLSLTPPILAIKGKYFTDEMNDDDGTIKLLNGNYTLQFGHKNLLYTTATTTNAIASTGLQIWDGAILLSRYIEYYYGTILSNRLYGQHILELGSGCGIVGMTAAILGATSVTVTDLPELIPFLQSNVNINVETIQKARDDQLLFTNHNNTEFITCRSLDWTEPIPSDITQTTYTLILIADCIWIESLVTPLFATLKELTNPSNHVNVPNFDDSINETTMHASTNNIGMINVPDTIVEDEFANYSISHLDLNKPQFIEKAKNEMDDESPVNSNTDIYYKSTGSVGTHNYSHTRFHHSNLDATTNINHDRSISNNSMDLSYQLQTSSSVLDYQQQDVPTTTSSTTTTATNSGPTVLISYQQRGKSTHETFIKELYELFTHVEIVTAPNLNYPQDIFYLYSCRR